MKFKNCLIIAVMVILSGLFALTVSAKDKVSFKDDFIACQSDILLTQTSQKWTDFRSRGFTQWKPYVTNDPENAENKVLAIDKNTASATTKNEHLGTVNDLLSGQLTSSFRFYIPSDKMASGGILYNSTASNESITIGMVDSSNAANFLIYSYIRPNTAAGAQIYSHGQTKIVEKDMWHTIKMTVDTETGKRETYLDGELLYSSVIDSIKGKSMSEFRISVTGALSESLVYVDDIKLTAPDTEWLYDIKDVIYSNGTTYTAFPEAGGMLKSIKIEKSSLADGSGMLVAAYFNKNRELEKISFADFNKENFTEENALININMSLPEGLTEGTVKIFIWDKEGKIRPLENTFVSEISKVEPTLYLIGDSTMATYTERDFPRAGIGQMAGLFFKNIDVVNYGSSGKTTATYLEYEGWENTLNSVKSGDYAVIQLGINDTIYDIGTDTYYNNLKFMTDTLLERGVNVIVNTPSVRRMFDSNGKFMSTFDENGKFVSTDVYVKNGKNYYETVKEFISVYSGKEGFFSVDMTAKTASLIGPNATTDDSTRRFYMQDVYYNWDDSYAQDPRAAESRYADKNSNNYKNCQTDHTHLTYYGATIFAKELAKGIKELGIPLSAYVINLNKPVYYPDGLSGEGVVTEIATKNTAVFVTSEVYGREKAYATDSNPQTYWQSDELPMAEDKGKSLMLDKIYSDDSMLLAEYSFAPEKNILVFEEDVLVTDITGEKALPYFYGSDGEIALTTVITDSKMVVTGSTIVSEVKPDTWYKLKFIFNIPNRTCDVYVDGVLKLSNKSFREDADNISSIRYHITNGNAGQFYADNIKITRGEGGETILDENFENYNEGESLSSMWKTASEEGNVCAERYDPSERSKFPQNIVLDLKKIDYLENIEITFPHNCFYKFKAEVSKNGKNYAHIAVFDDKFYGGTVNFSVSPVAGRFLRITFIDGEGDVLPAVSEIKVTSGPKTPEENLAFTANIKSSSANSGYDARNLNDNIISCFDNIGEWRAASNDSSPWIQLSWDEEKTVDRVVLYPSVQPKDNIKTGLLSFSDGSSIEVTDIPKAGTPLVIDFETKKITYIRFTITKYEGTASLSEMQVYPEGEKPELIEYIEPWKVVTINEDYGSKWLVSADIDNDGDVELISARSQTEQFNVDNHAVKTACAMELDGSLIWTWGVKGEGLTTMGADSACQVYDIDNDGILEVLLCTQTEFVILDARNGQEEKRYPLPVGQSHPSEWATDCIVIANISGNSYPSDIIVKSRYHEAWAYTKDWEPIWHVSMPGGMKIGHQPLPVDIDNDGYDEVMVGYSLVNPDGSYRWIMDKTEYLSDLKKGHTDSVKILNHGEGVKPEDIRICLCLCGACDIVMIDGNGKRVWAEEDGLHYETILTGNLMKGSDETFIISNPNVPEYMDESGNQPIYIHDINGNLLVKRYGFEWNRKPSIINWSGDEDWIYMPADGVMVDINMNIMARTLAPVRGHDSAMAYNVSSGDTVYRLDFNGDGRQDLANLTDAGGKVELYIYLNENGKIVSDGTGSGYNVSFY